MLDRSIRKAVSKELGLKNQRIVRGLEKSHFQPNQKRSAKYGRAEIENDKNKIVFRQRLQSGAARRMQERNAPGERPQHENYKIE